jgi:hypothetical protein
MVAISILESASAVHAGGGALVWLGIALLALAASAAGVFWWLRAGATRVGAAERAATGALPLTCPACRRSYPTGTIFCPIDASRVVASRDGAVAERGAGGKCPRCRRVYDGATRFCAVDAEELVPLPLWPATHAEGGLHVDTEEAAAARAGAVHFHGEGKICPVCAAKYDLEASFCGRDGSELVTVN